MVGKSNSSVRSTRPGYSRSMLLVDLDQLRASSRRSRTGCRCTSTRLPASAASQMALSCSSIVAARVMDAGPRCASPQSCAAPRAPRRTRHRRSPLPAGAAGSCRWWSSGMRLTGTTSRHFQAGLFVDRAARPAWQSAGNPARSPRCSTNTTSCSVCAPGGAHAGGDHLAELQAFGAAARCSRDRAGSSSGR